MANDLIFSNNASALLAASIIPADTTIQVASGFGAVFPTPSGGSFFYATLEDNSGNIEVVKCTGRVGDVLTVERGQDGTTAQNFTLTVTRVELRLVRACMTELLQKNGGTMTGNLDMNGLNIVDAVLSGTGTKFTAGEIYGVPLRGATGLTSNQIDVPAGGGRATAGGVEIVVSTDPIVSQATESQLGTAEIATQAEMDTGIDDVRYVTPLKFKNTAASETVNGTLLLASEAEVTANSPAVADKAITPVTLAARTATETRVGLVEKATQAEVDAGTDTDRYVTPATLAATPSVLNTFTGVSSITGLTVGKKYLVSIYGITANKGNDSATLGAVRVGTTATPGGGTQLASTGSQSINWPDGQAPQSATMIITATTADINGAVDWTSSGSFQTPKYMCAVQLD